MSDSSPITRCQAFTGYFNSATNIALGLNALAYMVTHFNSSLSKRLNEVVSPVFGLLSIGFAGNTLYSFFADWETHRILTSSYYRLSRVEEGQRNVLRKQLPADGAFKGDTGWITYRSIRHIAKLISRVIVIRHFLQKMNIISSSPSSLLSRVEPCAAMVAYGLDIFDLQKKKIDHGDKKGEEYQNNATINQMEHVIMIAACLATFVLTFKANENCQGGAMGKAADLVSAHANNIYGGLFALHLGIRLARHVYYRETIKESKQDEERLKSNRPVLKFLTDEFPGSHSFTRLVTILSEFASFGEISRASKNLDALFYIAKLFGSCESFSKAAHKLDKKGPSKTTADAVREFAVPAFDFISTGFGLMKWALQFTCYKKYGKYFTYVKSVASILAAASYIKQSLEDIKELREMSFKCENEKQKEILETVKNIETVFRYLTIPTKAIGLFSNVLTVWRTYAEPMTKPEDRLPPSFWLGLRSVCFVGGFVKDFHKAWVS